MRKRDPKVDVYIARSAEFAKPILEHLRGVVHETCPDVEEAMKWSFPSFLYKGMLCSMAAFKQHCAFRFWKGDLILGASGGSGTQAMGQFGRITKLADLPPKKVLAGHIRKAMQLNEGGVKPRWLEARNAKRAGTRAKAAAVPADLAAALRKSARARATFEKFPPSHKREYVEWIAGAKRAETRARRLATAIKWMAEGKRQNWRYEK